MQTFTFLLLQVHLLSSQCSHSPLCEPSWLPKPMHCYTSTHTLLAWYQSSIHSFTRSQCLSPMSPCLSGQLSPPLTESWLLILTTKFDKAFFCLPFSNEASCSGWTLSANLTPSEPPHPSTSWLVHQISCGGTNTQDRVSFTCPYMLFPDKNILIMNYS